MTKQRIIPASELIINEDGSIFHLHLKPEQISDIVMLVGDPARVDMIASYFDEIECNVSSRGSSHDRPLYGYRYRQYRHCGYRA